jgi:hypothetical protein
MGKWCQQTHAEFIKDPEKQFLLPLIFYIDETDTDVFQRHPLEPLMFTLGILCNFLREKSSAWRRHAGFIPKVSQRVPEKQWVNDWDRWNWERWKRHWPNFTVSEVLQNFTTKLHRG